MIRSLTLRALLFAALALLAGRSLAQNPFVGEYEGTFTPDKVKTLKATAKVVAEGPDYYRLTLKAEPAQPGQLGADLEIHGVLQGRNVSLFGRSGGRDWSGQISGDRMVGTGNYYELGFELKKITRKSPTEGLKPPQDAIVLLPYEPGKAPDMSLWRNKEWKALEDGSMEITPGKGSTDTLRNFKDVKLHIEFWLPLQPNHFGQERANSGVFFNGTYEVQVLDSFGFFQSMGDCGSIYDVSRPLVDAILPPETWQTYDITFHAPRLKANGEVEKLPRITVELNGQLIQKDVEIPGPTGRDPKDPKSKQVVTGPIGMQDHGHPVRYRNIWLTELKDSE